MSQPGTPERTYWRVGYHANPLAFPPLDIYAFNHRFDDIEQRFRTLYCAELPETCLREVVADFRPNHAAIKRHVEQYGPEAIEDIPEHQLTAEWRMQHVLIPLTLELDGDLIDLTDTATRQEIEDEHIELLMKYELPHLDLHEITTQRRPVTQTIATSVFDRGASGIRFPSRLDGNPCIALFEGRGELEVAGDPIALTDPPPEALQNVIAPWRLTLEPAAAAARR